MVIEKHILNLLTVDGFNLKFDDMLQDYPNMDSCYEALEAIFKGHFGKTRYSSYEAFRVTRWRWLKNKRNNVTM